MKKITSYVLPRYIWFLLWYKQWFKNSEGIKQFAHQVMNWLMQSTLRLASKLKKTNKKLSEKIRQCKEVLLKLYNHPVIEADEFDTLQSKIRKLGISVFVILIGETALNYFAVKSLITAKGWGFLALQVFLALGLTVGGIYIFERLIAAIINKPKYKQETAERVSWKEIIFLSLAAIAYEALIYYLCRVRGITLEGSNAESYFTYAVMLSGMILPVIAGYLSYERSIYISAYRNTLRIANLEKKVAKMENKMAINRQKMENHFKKECQDRWAFLQEFKVYKENYNEQHNIKQEDLTGHYAETQDSFIIEAINRYKRETITEEALKPTVILKDEKLNGQVKELFSNINL